MMDKWVDTILDLMSGAHVERLKQQNDKLRAIIAGMERQEITKEEARQMLDDMGYEIKQEKNDEK